MPATMYLRWIGSNSASCAAKVVRLVAAMPSDKSMDGTVGGVPEPATMIVVDADRRLLSKGDFAPKPLILTLAPGAWST